MNAFLKSIVLLGLVSLTLSSHSINKKFVEQLKKVAPFEVYEVEENPFRDWTDEELKNMVMNSSEEKLPRAEPKRAGRKNLRREKNKPNPFDPPYDFRKDHPECIKPIRNQGECAAGYAFSLAITAQQRFCYRTSGATNVVLSAQCILSCCKELDPLKCQGCNGCDLLGFWMFPPYMVEEDCWPYTSETGSVEGCRTECPTGLEWKLYTMSDSKVLYSPEEIIEEIPKFGPAATEFIVYEDFLNYKSGIYQHVTGLHKGKHVVPIIGFGTEGDIDYFIAENTWGPEWGESGYFRIQNNEAQFGKTGYSAVPDI